MNKILVIGYGSIAKRHITLLKEKFPKSQIIVSRSSEEKAKQTIKDVNLVITKIDEVLDQIDVAFICSPATLHKESIEKLALKQIPIFCEKPMVINMEEAKMLKDKIQGTHFFLGYVLRFLPALNFLKKNLDSKKYGDVFHVRAEIGQYLPTWRKNTDYRKSVSANRKFGGGSTLELSHEVDYLFYLFGKPSQVFASEKKVSNLEIDVEDTTDILFLNEDFNISLHMDMLQMQTTRQLKIVLSKANILWDAIESKVTIFQDNDVIEEHKFNNKDMYKDQLESFCDSLSSKSSPIDFEQGFAVMEILDAIKRSSSKGVVIKL